MTNEDRAALHTDVFLVVEPIAAQLDAAVHDAFEKSWPNEKEIVSHVGKLLGLENNPDVAVFVGTLMKVRGLITVSWEKLYLARTGPLAKALDVYAHARRLMIRKLMRAITNEVADASTDR